MATEIKIKRSAVSGNIPTTSQISTGELALNMADRDIYYSDGSNVKRVKGHYTGSSAPSSPAPVEGDLWYDTTADALKTYDGSVWNSTTSSGGLSEEEVQDTIAGMLQAGSNVSLTYNDVSNALEITSEIPNLNEGNFFLGNASNESVSANFDTEVGNVITTDVTKTLSMP